MSRIKSSLLVFAFVLFCSMSVCSVYAEPVMEKIIAEHDLAMKSTALPQEESLGYVPNQIIVELKKSSAGRVEAELASGKRAGTLSISESIDLLNSKYNLQNITSVFPNFKKNHEKLEKVKTKDKNKLTKKEKHILQRSKRAPKDAKVPPLDRIYLLEFELTEDQSLEDAAAEFRADKGIHSAELNYIARICKEPNDSQYDQQWALNSTVGDHDIDAPEAWDITTGSSDIIVAVVDTGVDYTHPDLQGNIWINEEEFYGEISVDDDDNGYIDDVQGWNKWNANPFPLDSDGHGTHCAGIISAKGNNALNVSGVSWDTKIMCVKVGDSSFNLSNTIYGVYYAIDNGADVVSCSFGGYDTGSGTSYQVVADYAYSQGVIVVAAAGNDNTNDLHYPSACENVISVAATDSSDNKANFSNYGEWVDIAAPGVGILSLIPGSSTGSKGGTSMACPHVSGACALLLSVMPDLSVYDVNQIITTTGDPITDGICYSDSRLNLFNAIIAALPEAGKVVLDREVYSCPDTIDISLYDADLYGNGTSTVTITTSNGDSETVVLYESTFDSGAFFGDIVTSGDSADPNDGVLQVADANSITVTYDDADDGTGNPDVVIKTAIADSIAPVVTDHQIEVPGPNPTITIDTNEQVTATVYCGTQAGGPYEITAENNLLDITHKVKLEGVSPSTTYYYVIEIADEAGNVTLDDNSGQDYSFTTTAPGDIYVPVGASTIQKAVDYSWVGGTVWLADGTYTGSGNRDVIVSKSITIRSETDPNNCIINCQGTVQNPHRAFFILNGEGIDCSIKGLTITNGYSADYFKGGSGVLFSCSGKVTIDNCLFTNNSTTRILRGGSAIRVHNPGEIFSNVQAVITNCTFSNNSADAVASSACHDLSVNNCVFTGNEDDSISIYGFSDINKSMVRIEDTNFLNNDRGVYARHTKIEYFGCVFEGNASGGIQHEKCIAEVLDCSFLNNTAGLGAGVFEYSNSSNSRYANCIFKGNSASDKGGAVYFLSHGHGGDIVQSLEDCLFIDNSATSKGGAIGMRNTDELRNSYDILVSNCTFSGNSAGMANTFYAESPVVGEIPIRFNSSIIWDDANSLVIDGPTMPVIIYSDIEGGYAGEGNINVDPNFVDVANSDYSLSVESPCFNAGDPEYEYSGQKDLAGLPRVLCDRVDMGAYEISCVYNLDQEQRYATIQQAIDDAYDLDEIIVCPRRYEEQIDFNGKAITLVSYDPNDPNIISATVIDANGLSGDVVTFSSSEDANSILAGFTITGGSGAGIYCTGSGTTPVITNCVVEENELYGIRCSTYSSPLITNSKIRDNSGTGIHCNSHATPVIKNNIIIDNECGLCVTDGSYQGSWVVISNNTIVNNTVSGVSWTGTSEPIINCIVWNNGDDLKFDASAVYSCIQDGDGVSDPNTHNIDEDPCFVDPNNGDYHLSVDSPCLEAGDPAGNYSDQTDLDGSNRVAGSSVDMGAYEYEGIFNTNAQTWHPTIQSAIDSAAIGDVIELYPDTYTGTGNRDIDFGGKSITVRSTDGPDTCIIDCQATDTDRHRGFHFHSGEDANSVLDGLTIVNGMAPYDTNSGFYSGSAVFCNNASSPTIRNCIMENNIDLDSASDGVIACHDSSESMIQNCTLRNNTSYYSIVFAWSSSPTIINCLVDTNTDMYAPILCSGNGNASIIDCRISNNLTRGAAGIYIYTSSPHIENCIINDNDAELGGGLYLRGSTNVTARNCLISNNTADSGGGICNMGGYLYVTNCTIANNDGTSYGGGIYVSDGYSDFTNTIIWGNNPDQVKKISGTTIFAYCDIEDSGGSASWDTTLGTDGGGNIDNDPNFIDASNGNYHIIADSNCIDAGDPNYIADPNEDIDSQYRILRGRVDIGADEVGYIGDLNGDDNIDSNDLTLLTKLLVENSYTVVDPILGEYKVYEIFPEDEAWMEEADINSNDIINPSDQTALVNLILQQ